MMRASLQILVLLISALPLKAQLHRIKPTGELPANKTNFALGAGLARSVLYLSRNVKPDNDVYGLHTSLVYSARGQFRYSAEYTYYRPLQIPPTWRDVTAHTIEANMNILFRIPDGEGTFYPLFGISYNVFSGFFTGINDFLNLSSLYKPNEWVSTRWTGINIGTGYEHLFGRVSIYGDYKMRLGITENNRQFNIVDVCINAGLRYHLRVKPIGKWFRGTRSRYQLHKSHAG